MSFSSKVVNAFLSSVVVYDKIFAINADIRGDCSFVFKRERERERENAVRGEERERRKKNETKKTTLRKRDERGNTHRVESARRFRHFPHFFFFLSSSALSVLSA